MTKGNKILFLISVVFILFGIGLIISYQHKCNQIQDRATEMQKRDIYTVEGTLTGYNLYENTYYFLDDSGNTWSFQHEEGYQEDMPVILIIDGKFTDTLEDDILVNAYPK